MDEFFPNEFMGSSLEADHTYQRKGPDDFVGEYHELASRFVIKADSYAAFRPSNCRAL